jgi:hypothetical protein
MTLDFPNRSRSFDEARNAVRFTGYDGMFEVPFFVEAAALANQGGRPDRIRASEAEYLAAFDAARGSIYDVARESLLQWPLHLLQIDRGRFPMKAADVSSTRILGTTRPNCGRLAPGRSQASVLATTVRLSCAGAATIMASAR